MIPAPKKIQVGDSMVHCSTFDTNISLTLTNKECVKRVHDGSLVLPLVFIAKCKDMIQEHTEQIRSWFNPAPSVSTIQNVTHLPETIPWNSENAHNLQHVIVRVRGIIVESNRILPYITLDYVEHTTPDLTASLASDDIQEITDDIIVRDLEDGDDVDDDVDDDEDDDEDEDEDEDDRFERVQRSLDAAREELERLRRGRYRS
jgi:hypothetical protein